MTYDKIILGAGLYGLYSALLCGEKGDKVLVLEVDDTAFKRATFINQARVHMGYHYPRSYSTAIKSAHYFERFNEDFDFCINREFSQIYATGANFSWTNASEFKRFCHSANIPCEQIDENKYFNSGTVDGAFLTKEYTYDAQILKNWLL
ncbi:MAG: amino acid oxidase, partial [Oscillospiraceae bacterium]